jgi:hypothetical protein
MILTRIGGKGLKNLLYSIFRQLEAVGESCPRRFPRNDEPAAPCRAADGLLRNQYLAIRKIQPEGRRIMEEFEKIAVLDNEIQARLLESILSERDIPHRLRSYHDSAYDGIFQTQKGWGIIQAPGGYKEEIQAILKDLPLKDTGAVGED